MGTYTPILCYTSIPEFSCLVLILLCARKELRDMEEYDALKALLQHYFHKDIKDFKPTLDQPLNTKLLNQ